MTVDGSQAKVFEDDTLVGTAMGPALDETDGIGAAEPTLADLVGEVTKDLGALVGMHVDLAKAELKEDVSQAVVSGRDFGIGAFAGYMTVVMLSFSVAALLAVWLPAWAGLGIVTLLWAVLAAVMLTRGKAHLRAIDMNETVSTVKGDVAWAQQQKS